MLNNPIVNSEATETTQNEAIDLNVDMNLTDIVSREMRIWPMEEQAKKGSFKGHCMNND